MKCNQCKFDGNCLIIEDKNSKSYGGAIGIILSSIDCNDCTFVNNNASTSFTGNDASIASSGCIFMKNLMITLITAYFCVLISVILILAYANGAAIYFSKSIIDVNHCSFIRNECSSTVPKSNCFEGTIYLQRSIGTFTNFTFKRVD